VRGRIRLLGSRSQQCERDEVGEQAEHGDDEHRRAEHLGFGAEAADRLDDHPGGHGEQQQRVHECREDFEPVETEGVLRSSRGRGPELLEPGGESDRRQRQGDADRVGEHVSRVGQQRERVRGERL